MVLVVVMWITPKAFSLGSWGVFWWFDVQIFATLFAQGLQAVQLIQARAINPFPLSAFNSSAELICER